MGLDMYLDRTIAGGAEEVGYWRKANAIHKWFVDNVQNGEDDCQRYDVTPAQLTELLVTVNTVLDSVTLIDDTVSNGYTINSFGVRDPILQDGKVIADPSVAAQLLPTADGFFFGNTDYDERYVRILQETKDILEHALADVESADSATQFTYQASW